MIKVSKNSTLILNDYLMRLKHISFKNNSTPSIAPNLHSPALKFYVNKGNLKLCADETSQIILYDFVVVKFYYIQGDPYLILFFEKRLRKEFSEFSTKVALVNGNVCRLIVWDIVDEHFHCHVNFLDGLVKFWKVPHPEEKYFDFSPA